MMTEQTDMTTVPEEGYPVDVREEEFTAFSMKMARSFGSLRLQKPMLVCFIAYLLIAVVLIVWEYLDTHTVSLTLVGVAALSLLCTVPGLVLVPKKTKRAAEQSYRDNNDNGYYGEILLENGELVKVCGYKRFCIPLNEKAVYFEDTDYMAFAAVGGMTSTILLPARCMTEEMATAVRQTVFDPACRIQRRVNHRMAAQATHPIPKKEPLPLPKTLYDLQFSYQPDELRTMMQDVGRRRMIKNLPTTLITAVGLGTAVMLCMDSVWALVMTVPAMLLLSILISSLNTAATAKKVSLTQMVRVHMALTERGPEFESQPGGRQLHMRWQGVRRATETETAVEFYFGDEQMLRIPKRCIENIDALRQIVNTYRKPQ